MGGSVSSRLAMVLLAVVVAEYARTEETSPADPMAAVEWHRRQAEDVSLPARTRIEAWSRMAESWVRTQDGLELHRMDLALAEKALRRALEVADASPSDLADAWIHLGRFYERQDRFEEARACYAKAAELDPSPAGQAKAARAQASAWLAEGNEEQARAIYESRGFDLIELDSKLGRWDRVAERCEQTVGDTNLDIRIRWRAFSRHSVWNWRNAEEETLRTLCDRWMPLFVQSDSNRPLILLQKFKNAFSRRPTFIAWAAPWLLSAPDLSSTDRDLVLSAQFQALASLGRVSDLMAAAERAASDLRASPKVRYRARLIVRAFSPEFREGSASAAAEDLAVSFREVKLTAEERCDAVQGVARALLAAGRESEARKWHRAAEEMRAPYPRAVLPCVYQSEAPRDISGWLASPLIQDFTRAGRLNRPYGENLSFLLETDSAVTGRNAAPKQNDVRAGEEETAVWAACDSEGIWFFFLTRHLHPPKKMEGPIWAGSYEGYLTSGQTDPYYFFLIEIPSGRLSSSFRTSYRHRTHRLVDVERGTLRTDTRRCGDGIATVLFYGWELFYDRLPTDGGEWLFETIRWTAAGGVSLGGSRSVHNPSHWASLIFQGLNEENRRAIRRRLIQKAVASYREMRRDPGGPVGWWADWDLGDPVFYNKAVRPLVERLDVWAEETVSDMSDETVERLFREAVPRWLEFDLELSTLREYYLKEMWTEIP